MAQKRCGMKKIRQIIKLSQETNLSRRVIAHTTGSSRPTVSRYIDAFAKSGLGNDDVDTLSDSELLQALFPPVTATDSKLATLYTCFPEMAKELKSVGVTRQLLWQEYKIQHPDGYGYTQFCEHFSRWSKSDPEVTASLDHTAGDRMYVDYAGKKLSYTCRETGREIPVDFFIAILGASQYTYAEATPSQKKADWIISNRNAIEFFGGSPASIMPDCLKSGVVKGCKYEPEINPEYKAFADHYGTVIIPARPHHPRDKALVENMVSILYTRIYAKLRKTTFYSLEELNSAIRGFLDEHNATPFQKMPSSRSELFEDIERDTLTPLPEYRYEIVEYRRQTIPSSYHVEVREDGCHYSVPWRYAGKKVQIACSRHTIEVYHENIRIAFHCRQRPHGKITRVTLPEHRHERHKFYGELSKESVCDKAAVLGIHTEKIVRSMLSSAAHPEQGIKKASGILSLAKKFGSDRTDTACKVALINKDYSYRGVKKILDNGEDLRFLEFEKAQLHLPLHHENLRGQSAYE